MYEQKINEIKRKAHSVDFRINLFEGYSPKKVEGCKGELLFWKHVVNLYGLFADCDRVQIKEKKNLIELMKRYSLIDRNDYDMARVFWKDISELRKWFCHNNDDTLFYQRNSQAKLKWYIDRAIPLSTSKPQTLEEIQVKEWDLLTFDLERRFEVYLDILIKGFSAWIDSPDREDLLDEWLEIFSKALFGDKELLQNVVADLAAYEKMNQGNNSTNVLSLAKLYYSKLESCEFSASDIEETLRNVIVSKCSNREIVLESIRHMNLT